MNADKAVYLFLYWAHGRWRHRFWSTTCRQFHISSDFNGSIVCVCRTVSVSRGKERSAIKYRRYADCLWKSDDKREFFSGKRKDICRAYMSFLFVLKIQPVSDISKADQQVFKDIDFYCGIEWILDIEHISFKIVYRYSFAARICNPIFTDSGIFVIVQFADIIVCRVAGGNNFNDASFNFSSNGAWNTLHGPFLLFRYVLSIVESSMEMIWCSCDGLAISKAIFSKTSVLLFSGRASYCSRVIVSGCGGNAGDISRNFLSIVFKSIAQGTESYNMQVQVRNWKQIRHCVAVEAASRTLFTGEL